MKAEMKENVFEKEFGNSFGIDGFVAWGENYPLRKAVVDHDQEGIETGGGRQIGDKVNRELLERARTGGGHGGEGRDGQVGIHLHLLAKGTACYV